MPAETDAERIARIRNLPRCGGGVEIPSNDRNWLCDAAEAKGAAERERDIVIECNKTRTDALNEALARADRLAAEVAEAKRLLRSFVSAGESEIPALYATVEAARKLLASGPDRPTTTGE